MLAEWRFPLTEENGESMEYKLALAKAGLVRTPAGFSNQTNKQNL